MGKYVALCLMLAPIAASASPHFTCKDPGPCYCMLSTAEYYSRTDGRVTVSCINLRTGEHRYFDSVSRTDWEAANKKGQEAKGK